MFDKQRETGHGKRGREFKETGWYPEMVWYYRQKFNPSEESAREFSERQKRYHARFLRKRGWNEESINLAWTEILASLSHKYSNFSEAVEALREAETRRHRKFKIAGRYFKS